MSDAAMAALLRCVALDGGDGLVAHCYWLAGVATEHGWRAQEIARYQAALAGEGALLVLALIGCGILLWRGRGWRYG